MSAPMQQCDDAHHEMMNGPRVRQSLAASSCSRLANSIIAARSYVEQSAAVEAVERIPSDHLDGAWAWTATYLVALEKRISSENSSIEPTKGSDNL
jgi:hypothetical protein